MARTFGIEHHLALGNDILGADLGVVPIHMEYRSRAAQLAIGRGNPNAGFIIP